MTFYPREAKLYNDVLKLEVNRLSTIDIPVIGEGADLRIEAEPNSTSFGALKIGNAAVKAIKITNKGSIPTVAKLGPNNNLMDLANMGVKISALQKTAILPKSSVILEIKFQPTRRIPHFSEEIFVECAGTSKKLFIISGSCILPGNRSETRE